MISRVETPQTTKPNINTSYLNDASAAITDFKSVSVQVRNLSVSARPRKAASFLSKFKRKPSKDIATITTAAANELTNDTEKNVPPTEPILHPTSMDFPAGSLSAIIGGSGSGKTTLLNVLADRTSGSTLLKTGIILYNGSSLSTVRDAYVIQQDILSPGLTARETLRYAAELRLPASTTHQERLGLVEKIVLELGLKDCADTIVGDSVRKGLSGGEKRRLSIGIQMLSNPSLLFLDEPTTGLDAHSAYLLIQTLKNLAQKGRTIIISIHQPRSDIFFLFDYLCILSKGRTVYNYKVKDHVLPYFEKLGYHVPENVNPADYLIDITTVDTRTKESEERGLKSLEIFDQKWKEYQKSILRTRSNFKTETKSQSIEIIEKTRPPFWRELNVLTRRTALLTIRDSFTLLSMLLEAILMGLMCGWVFYKPEQNLAGIKTTLSAIYAANALQGYLMLLFEVYRLTASDIKVYDRERADNCITIPGFLISRRLAKLFLEDVLVTLCYASITYLMFGLQSNVRKFFIYWSAIFLIHLCSMTGAVLFVAMSRNFATASLLSNMNYTLQSFACGYFVNTKQMPVYIKWTKYVAYVWYGFGCLVSNQFTNFNGDCPLDDIDSEACSVYRGDYVIKEYGFWENWISVPLVGIACWVVGFYIIGGIVLHFKKVDVSLSKQLKYTRSYEERTKVENEKTKNLGKNDLVDLNIQNICLSVQLKKDRKKYDKLILDHISATFKGGKINAIMGPSGSGKSSLLNLISGRLSSDLVNKYKASGDVLFNDLKVHTKMANTICSYVSQDDDHLISALSVRETLDLAADLRIGHLPRVERNTVVDDIIGKLALRPCANTLIGSQFVKGISGGEKRRVSMAIQLLNNPKILLLDEPTSGLDSFTASSILEILQDLADEGKTIILTIHQPRSDLAKKFGQVLLLAKGGVVGYNGSQKNMVEYFGNLGYPCDVLTNSADHVLDLISINNQSLEKEMASSDRVKALLENWKNETKKITSLDEIDYPRKAITETEFNDKFGRYIRKPAPFGVAFYSCCKQSLLTFWRNQEILTARLTNVLGVAVILALYIAPLGDDYSSIQNRLGLIQQFTSLYFCGMLNNLSTYPGARNYFYHEYHDHVYGIAPFFLSYTLLEIPFELVSCVCFTLLTDIACGLPRTPEFFFTTVYITMCVVFCGESLGIMTNTLFQHAGLAVNTVSVFLSIGTFMAGAMSLQMDRVLKGINYLSPLNYALVIELNMAFSSDVKFTCDATTMNTDGSCIFANGNDVLETYSLKDDNYKAYFASLLCIVLVYRVLAYGLLKLKLLKIDLGSFRSNAGEV